MIEAKNLAQLIESGLNATGETLGRRFRIFADAGLMRLARQKETEVVPLDELTATVYGVLSVSPSQLVPIKGLYMATINASLEMLVELPRQGEEDGEYPELDEVRGIVCAYIEGENGATYATEGNTSVTVSFSPVTTGGRVQATSEFGDGITLMLNLSAVEVENGIASNEVTITLDGHPVYYQAAVISRAKTSEVFNESTAAAKTIIQQSGFGVDITAPLLTSAAGRIFSASLLDASRAYDAHAVKVEIGAQSAVYLCVLGTTQATARAGENVGITAALAECLAPLATFPTDGDAAWRVSTQVQTGATFPVDGNASEVYAIAMVNGVWGDLKAYPVNGGQWIFTDEIGINRAEVRWIYGQ